MQQKSFGGRAQSGPARGAHGAPPDPLWLDLGEGEGEGEGEEEERDR
jgi:hypothetical protein